MKSYEPQFRSKRIFESLKREITVTSLPQQWNDVLHTSSRWGTGAVITHLTDNYIEIFSKTSKLVSLRNPPKKGFYMFSFDCLFPCNDHDPRGWCDIQNLLTKNKCHLIWKVMHGAILNR